jgi:hypothetical protein
MATAWQTLEEAALTLGISSRTLHRRLAKGEFETRLENGRREVLVVIPDPEPIAGSESWAPVADNDLEVSVTPDHTAAAMTEPGFEASAVTDTSDHFEQHAVAVTDEIQQTMLALHEDRIRRTDLAIMAYQQSVNVTAADSRRAHRNARVAWGLAGTVVAGLFVAGVWATHSVTKANAELNHLNHIVRQLSDTAEAKAREADTYRQQAEGAKLASARVEGELSAPRGQISQLMQLQAATAAARQTRQTGPSDTSGTPQPGTPAQGQPPGVPATQPSATRSPAAAMDSLMQRITLQ